METLPASPPETRAGRPAGRRARPAHRSRVSPPGEGASTVWEYHIPLVTNVFMLWDVLRISVAVFLLVEVAALATTALIDGEPLLIPVEVWAGVSAIGAALYLFAAGVVFKNDWHVRFSLDSRGVSCEGHLETGIVFRVLMWFRFLRLGLPLALLAVFVGAGSPRGRDIELTGGSRIAWRSLRRVTIHERLRVITLRGPWFESMRLYCTPAVYEAVRREAAFRGEFAEAWRRQHPEKPFEFSRAAWRRLLWALFSGAGTLSAQLWERDATAFTVAIAGGLVLLSGLLEGIWRRLAAGAGAAVAVLSLLLVRELALSTTDFAGGLIKVHGYEHDTPVLVISLAGTALLMGMALWRLLGADPRPAPRRGR